MDALLALYGCWVSLLDATSFNTSPAMVEPAALFLLSGHTSMKYYPPAPDSYLNLTWAVNGSGAPGIYNSSQMSLSEYGTYNWCSMPHVRKSEYIVPRGYELQYLEVIQRHHKRTPYPSNIFFREDVAWDCERGPYHHAKGRNPTTPVYWKSLSGSENPFEYTVGPGFVNSTCQFPSITSEGLDDSREHGEDFGGVYRDLLGFLSSANSRDYGFRVTNNDITSQTFSGFAAGLHPDSKEYPAWVQNPMYDSLEPSFSCPYASVVNAAYESDSREWKIHLDASSGVRERFNAIAGIWKYDRNWHASWDHPYDNLSAKQCHQKALPCNLNDTSICLSQEDADTIYRLGNYEYAYRWRGCECSLLYSALKMGPWFRELQAHLLAAAGGNSELKYLHNFAHDGSISAVLGILQIAYPVWPGMGSEVVFELWKNTATGQHFVRVLWSGQPLLTTTPLITLDMISLQDFVAYIDATIPRDLVAVCHRDS